jgi:hypothetical protein
MMFREGGPATVKKKHGQILKSSLNPRKYSREDMGKTIPGNRHLNYRHNYESSAESKMNMTGFSNYNAVYLRPVFKLNNRSLSSLIQPTKVFSIGV